MAKYLYPDMPEFKNPKALTNDEKEAKAEVLRVRAASSREASRDVIAALVNAGPDATIEGVKSDVAEALAYLAERAAGRKGTPGEGVARAPKSNVVADYFKDKKVGEKVDAADVFFDLDMDPARVLGSLKRFVSSVKDASQRVWVSYVKADRAYLVAGYGASKPAGFNAYDVEVNASDVA